MHVPLFQDIVDKYFSLYYALYPNGNEYQNEQLGLPVDLLPIKDQLFEALRPKYEEFINQLLLLFIFSELRSENDFSYCEKLSCFYSHSCNFQIIFTFSNNYLGSTFYDQVKSIDASLFKDISNKIFLKKDEKIQFRELTPLMYAILIENLPAMKILLNSDVDPNQIGKLYENLLDNSKDITPLELAVLSQSKDCVKILIEKGADVSDKCIQIALLKQNIDIYKVLIELRPVSLQLIIDTFQKSSRDVKFWFFQSEILNEEETKMLLKQIRFFQLDEFDGIRNLDCIKNNIISWLLTSIKEGDDQLKVRLYYYLPKSSKIPISNCIEAISKNDVDDFILIWLMYNPEEHKRFINTLQFEYLSILNTILNVIISILPWIYYSLTKGYQQITPHDLRFFAFGEKQKLEKFSWDHLKPSTP